MLIFISQTEVTHIISASGRALYLKDLPAICIAKFFGKKSILHFMGGAAVENSKHWRWYKKLPFLMSTITVLPTNEFKKSLILNKIKGNFHVIPHFVEICPFKNNDDLRMVPDRPILIAAKGMEDYAGHYQLLNIFQKIQAYIPNAELWFTSDGPERGRLETKTKDLGLNNVKYFGIVPRTQLIKLIKKANIFVHATKYESFGIALVEAMAAGLPIVAFKVGGIPDVVIHKKNGFLIKYLNDTDFVKRLMQLMQKQLWKD